MSLSAALWEASADQADAALAHPFVRGLGDGSLPLPAFQVYVAQDAVFLESFARAYAMALARSRDRATLEAFAELIAGVLEELRLHAAYAERWGPPPVTSFGWCWAAPDVCWGLACCWAWRYRSRSGACWKPCCSGCNRWIR